LDPVLPVEGVCRSGGINPISALHRPGI
jgi:hypothetical protein